jgi:methylthioribose-1-phosphate isomerase
MKINGTWYRPIWPDEDDPGLVRVIDQRRLPHEFAVLDIRDVDTAIFAIKDMVVRGAPLIGATGAWAMVLALRACPGGDQDAWLGREAARIAAARPTAVNLAWAVDRVAAAVRGAEDPEERISLARQLALEIADNEAECCRMIGVHGLPLVRDIHKKTNKTVNILTHCNAGWLACVDYGTATAPVYAAHDAGVPVHVWVDETRPLNQGARLTAFELAAHGVPHTVVTDNAGGHLMQHGMVDMVIVGTDRTTRTGDVANKVGTYLKALAARDNSVPFYVALPSSTIDWNMEDGVREIPIETRDPDEVRFVQGLFDGALVKVLVPPEKSQALNVAFDVTPARLVTGLVTERGVCGAGEKEILGLFPERA